MLYVLAFSELLHDFIQEAHMASRACMRACLWVDEHHTPDSVVPGAPSQPTACQGCFIQQRCICRHTCERLFAVSQLANTLQIVMYQHSQAGYASKCIEHKGFLTQGNIMHTRHHTTRMAQYIHTRSCDIQAEELQHQ